MRVFFRFITRLYGITICPILVAVIVIPSSLSAIMATEKRPKHRISKSCNKRDFNRKKKVYNINELQKLPKTLLVTN